MFLHSLSFLNRVVVNIIRNDGPNRIIKSVGRGRYISGTKTPAQVFANVMKHISLFSTYLSHYSPEKTESRKNVLILKYVKCIKRGGEICD